MSSYKDFKEILFSSDMKPQDKIDYVINIPHDDIFIISLAKTLIVSIITNSVLRQDKDRITLSREWLELLRKTIDLYEK